ncbi:hypothetical protein D9M72_421240 [compost metagenome]
MLRPHGADRFIRSQRVDLQRDARFKGLALQRGALAQVQAGVVEHAHAAEGRLAVHARVAGAGIDDGMLAFNAGLAAGRTAVDHHFMHLGGNHRRPHQRRQGSLGIDLQLGAAAGLTTHHVAQGHADRHWHHAVAFHLHVRARAEPWGTAQHGRRRCLRLGCRGLRHGRAGARQRRRTLCAGVLRQGHGRARHQACQPVLLRLCLHMNPRLECPGAPDPAPGLPGGRLDTEIIAFCCVCNSDFSRSMACKARRHIVRPSVISVPPGFLDAGPFRAQWEIPCFSTTRNSGGWLPCAACLP